MDLTLLLHTQTTEGLRMVLDGPGGYVFAGLMGAVIGSFVNVVAARLPKGMSVVSPSSRCMSCEAPIAAYDNIPVLSYLLLRGKCRGCGARFSPAYALVELAMAGLGVLCFYHAKGFAEGDPWLLLAHFLAEITFCATFASLALIDLKTWILPDRITYPAVFFFWGVAVSLGRLSWGDALAGAGLGFGSLAAIILGYKWLTGRDGMGWGDAKLLAVSGAFLGWQALPMIILLAAVQGLMAAVVLVVTRTSLEPTEPYLPLEGEDEEDQKNQEQHQEAENDEEEEPGDEASWRQIAMPFGPFLVLASLEALFFGSQLMEHLVGL